MKASPPSDCDRTPKVHRDSISASRVVSVGVSAIAIVVGLILLWAVFGLASAGLSDDSLLGGGTGLVLAAIVLVVAVLILGTSVAFFRATSSRSESNLQAGGFSFVFARFGVLFGLFMLFLTFGSLLEAAFPETFGRFPDPESAPWTACAAAVTLVPGLGFFRAQLSSKSAPPKSPLLGLSVLMFVGFPLLLIAGIGLLAALPLELLPTVHTIPALVLAASTLIMSLPILRLGFQLRSGFGQRGSPSGTAGNTEN